ncbi:galactosylgalactosylxylosylprotein 3-beta-glucuronosyltransferase P [Leptopilina boulardi]|uniref:galactosylgalactosylxylosylprotein 3-beta-glucuronosyltransferase P n=1 Tax=Leptopilina boulardi TaxID=63433 RepID=UPI0021F5580C|nr:galactosylgalactosylxylosylprotein 3-beta-glucuronosyltransferase P [Leptopilina boulardi]XP_051167530.1 galactosylgalactosylxylosylprotein 3-beta-glucuronosyltransferase P [Leptopilina boulardi]XP_051167531.1 galactosylgalactosylxylosylprotein 3-beta-glucuronosyltransferase P [Leptopilina boulardi]XP_051167532.1 galactosylgalactosylxylosylprotein 3-beta-glucuronosyltransferase P [Leptopilina boulardi]
MQRKMNPSMKVGMLALVGICLIFYQYHLSMRVRLDQVTGFTSPLDDSSNLQTGEEFEARITEEMIRTVVGTVQKNYGLSPDLAKQLRQEFINQLLISKNNGLANHQETTVKNVYQQSDESLDPLYIVTPTYRRPEQIAELTRMSHTLMLVKNVIWLVIEDATVTTPQVTTLLKRTGLKFIHLVAPMPEKYKQNKGAKPRGVSNRNRGLQWVRANATEGILYFADDDNTYDIALFDEIRKTKKVSMFPVGLCTKYGLSSPIVKDGKFQGFYDGWIAGRTFPVDMAGFAVNIKFLLQRPNASMPYKAGFEEDGFLKSLAPFEPKEIELLADNCTKILTWHTQTKKNDRSAPLNMNRYRSTNLVKLKQQIV